MLALMSSQGTLLWTTTSLFPTDGNKGTFLNLFLTLSKIVCISDFIAAHDEFIWAYVLPELLAKGSSWEIKSPFIMKASTFEF